MRLLWFWLFLLSLTVILLIAASNKRIAPEFHPASPSTQDCRPVSHELGEATLCGQPQRIAVLSPHILDSILSLGAQPVAYAEASTLRLRKFDHPKEQIPFLGRYVTTQPVNLGNRNNPSLELLTQLKPDVILGESWVSREQYRLLSRIAPTLLFSDEDENDYQHWSRDIKGIAKALDRTQQAEQLLNHYPQQIAVAKKQLATIVSAYPRVLVIHADSLAHAYLANNSKAADLLKMLGFKPVPSEDSPLKFAEEGQISIELLPTIEADLILVLAWAEELYSPEDAIQQQWAKHPLLRQMQAFKEGRVFIVDYQLWGSVTRGPITDQLLLEKLPQLLLPLLDQQEHVS